MQKITQDEQFHKMIETPVEKLILSLGLPTIVSMLVTNIYNMADTYFVSSIGTSASGATGIVFSLMAVLQAFGFMYGHGAGSNISRRLGAKDVEKAREYASTSFYLSILSGMLIMTFGILFMDPLIHFLGSTETIFPFAKIYAFWILVAGPAMTCSCVLNNILRYEGRAVYAMIGLTCGGVLNIVLDAWFINSFHMGIAGAGMATAISQYVSVVILLIPYLTNKTESRLSIRYFAHSASTVKDIIRVGFPSLIRQGLNSVSSILMNANAAVYGDAAVAAISIVNKIMNFLFCVAIGIGQGFQPVSAFNYGAGRYSRVKKSFFFALKLGMVLMAVLGLFGYLNASALVQFFRDDPSVISIGTAALRMQTATLVFMPITLCGNMLFQSIGISRTASLLAALRSGLVLIPLLYILIYFFGLTGLEASKAISEVISAILTMPFIIHFMRNIPADTALNMEKKI